MRFRAVSLDKLDEETIKNIRIWRNQDFVREMSFNKHIITESEHSAYINMVKEDPNRNIFVFYLDEKPFEVFQYELYPDRNAATCGNYLVNEEYQQLGYGAIGDLFIFFYGV